MVILSVNNVTKKFGNETLFDRLNFTVNEKDRVALIGANGNGKSTLLKIIIGQEEITRINFNEVPGSVAFAKGAKYGYLSQDVISSIDNTLREEAQLVFADLIALEKEIEILANQIADNSHNHKINELYGNKIIQFEHLGGYEYHYKISMILSKFGFPEEVIDRPIRTFSGGERTKMAFAKLLLLQPDVLLLDEPTNHLDVSTIDWLETYLKSYPGTILFVSHDRYFINTLANKLFELENGKIQTYVGDFDNYIIQKQERYELMMREYTIQQKEIEKIKRFITFFKPKPRFVSRAKDREKKLEHMVIKEKPNETKSNISFSFVGEVRTDKKVLFFDECAIGYEYPLVKPFSFYLFGGDKLAIIGNNGTGKTTLLKYIFGEQIPYRGAIQKYFPMNIGYIKQNDFVINDDKTILEYFVNEFPSLGEKYLRNHLGKFAFVTDDVFKAINVLSGGEKTRLMLAKIVLKNYDLLLLDEPTNHLDLLTRESLVLAMQEYKAPIVFVSHDRYFIDSVANKILFFNKGKPIYFEGNYEQFKDLEEKLAKKEEPTEKRSQSNNKIVSPKESKAKKGKVAGEIHLIEKRLEEIAELELLEENYMNYITMNKLSDEKAALEANYLELLENMND